MQHGKKGLWPRGSRLYRITVQSDTLHCLDHIWIVFKALKKIIKWSFKFDSEPCSKQMTAWSTLSTRPGVHLWAFSQWEVHATGPRLLDFTIVMLQWSDYPIFNQSLILKMTTVNLILDRQRCTTPIFNLVLIFKRWIKREEGGSGLWRHWMHNPLPSCLRPQFGLSHHYRHRPNCPHVWWRMRGRTRLWM